MNKNTVKIMFVVLSVVVLGIAYYGISPLFRNIEVHDAVPVSLTSETKGDQVSRSNNLFPVVDTVAHPATGTLRVITDGGKTFVRYENYKTINGPDLFVYLSKDQNAQEFVNLGELRGTEGNINYEVPEGINIDEYRYVLTWCKKFGVLFNSVDLKGTHAESIEEVKSAEQQKTEQGDALHVGASTSNPVARPETSSPQKAIMGTGCFWCVEHDFAKVEGVLDVVSGYAGGTNENPTYENYDDNGHREVVLVTYDPTIVSYGNLVEHTIKYGDPTDGGGSFFDRGEQYAPVIYYANEWEKNEAQAVIARIDALHVYEKPIAIEVVPAVLFWPAEAYHQDYAEKNTVKYNYYRLRSGRTAFIEKQWGENAGAFIASAKPIQDMKNGGTEGTTSQPSYRADSWKDFIKPTDSVLQGTLTSIQYEVTQNNATEKPFLNAYDKNYEDGIYVDIVSGEPLYFSKDKFDSGTGWPSFVKPISNEVVVLKEDNGLFSKRTEVRSRYADSHIGHVFDDGPQDRGGKRYCMNSAAMRFIGKPDMEKEGYGYLMPQL